MFIKPDATVEVRDDAGHCIVIKAKMDMATRAKVQDELLRVQAESDGGTRSGRRAALLNMNVSMGTQQLALLKANVVRWSGGELDGVPCTPEVIDTLDPDEPIVRQALEEIAQRNRPRRAEPRTAEEADDPNFSTAATSTDSSGGGEASSKTERRKK